MPTVEARVDRLERALEQFITSVGIEFNKLYNSQMQTEKELREFKEEMRVFREEMRAFREESERDRKALHEEMSAFKEEMREFKVEMRAFKDEMRQQTRDLNKKWGELANKMGTLVEDIVAPNIQRIAKELFGCKEIDFFAVRIEKRDKKRKKTREFDVIAVCNDIVILNETKSTPRQSYIKEFIEFIKKGEFFKYFPEYKGLKLIPVFSSLYLSDNTVKNLTKNKIYALAMKDDTMQILNPQLKLL